MNLTENEIIVHPINTKLLIERVDSIIPYKKTDEIIVTPEDGIIVVKEGFILISRDCCYQISETELQSFLIVTYEAPIYFESLRIAFRINRVSVVDLSTHTKHSVKNFSIVLPGDRLISESCLPAVTLKTFMAGRYNYNPRVIRNMKELIKLVNEYN